MEANITGQNDERVGLYVYDNNEIEHWIEMEFDGEIKYHEQDGYPDKAVKRTKDGNEHVEQARKFAQYYVYRQRGYDTVPASRHPERIEAVRQAIHGLSDDAFEDLFGGLSQQLASYHDPEVDRSITIPRGAPDSDSVIYRQNLYLEIDLGASEVADQVAELAAVHDIDLEEFADRSATDLSKTNLERWDEFVGEFTALVSESETDISESVSLGTVSSLYTSYIDETGDQQFQQPDRDPLEREPDTVLELLPVEPGSLSEFRMYLDHHLKCQVRDSFVRMGLEPPERFRVVGNGRFKAAVAYNLLDLYPKYYDPDSLDGRF
ncbi:hypothetical protein [Natrinema sp. 74]|uniref:hypothetical protein n=1 Tax=Natrinema sp. 74 TaxID=3384159 RepID=UPI0038D4A946